MSPTFIASVTQPTQARAALRSFSCSWSAFVSVARGVRDLASLLRTLILLPIQRREPLHQGRLGFSRFCRAFGSVIRGFRRTQLEQRVLRFASSTGRVWGSRAWIQEFSQLSPSATVKASDRGVSHIYEESRMKSKRYIYIHRVQSLQSS